MTDARAPAEPYTTTFEAAVEAIDGREVVLDRTYFYAESGGQPADRGTLASHRVVDVQHDDGEVVHALAEAPAFAVGDVVRGAVDEAFRTYCMRAHTASHALYGAGRRLLDDLGYGGFDIGERKVRVDLATPTDVDDDVLVDLERLTNRAVWESRPVAWESLPKAEALDSELVAFNTKTEEGIAGDEVRVVTIGDEGGAGSRSTDGSAVDGSTSDGRAMDGAASDGEAAGGSTPNGRATDRTASDGEAPDGSSSDESPAAGAAAAGRASDGEPWDVAACGGTHVRNTREIGPVTVLERSNPGEGLTRVEFTVGPPAIDRRATEKAVALDAARTLGTNVADLPEAVERLQADREAVAAERDALQDRLVDARVEDLRDDVVERDGHSWLVGTVAGPGPNELGERAKALAGDAADAVALVGEEDRTFLAVAAAGDVDAGEVVTAVTDEFGGGGGGGPDFAQGGGIDGTPRDVVDFLR